jgi:hypothetical protein
MIKWLSHAVLAILLVSSLILVCGCTGSEVVNLESGTPTISSNGEVNGSTAGLHPTMTPSRVVSPTSTSGTASTTSRPSIILTSMNKTVYSVGESSGAVVLTIIVDSSVPLQSYNVTLVGPAGAIFSTTFVGNATSLGNNRWEYDIPYYDPVLTTTGTYTYDNLKVMDVNGHWSDQGNSVAFQVKTPTPTPYVDKPVISTIKMDKSLYTQNDTYAIMTIVVNSQTPIIKKFLSLEGPNGRQVVGKDFSDQVSSIGNDQWTFQISYPIIQLGSSGTYTWDQIQITNANNLTSDQGPSVSFQVSKVADI